MAAAKTLDDHLHEEIRIRSDHTNVAIVLQENARFYKKEQMNLTFMEKYRINDDQINNAKVLSFLRSAYLDSIVCSRGT